MSKKPVILILAAGNSTRMGSPKQLLPYQDSTLLGCILKEGSAAASEELFCILGGNAKDIRAALPPSEVRFLTNPEPEKGLGSSISKAVGEILQLFPECPGILILLGDQPHVNKGFINLLIRSFLNFPQQVIAADYGSRIGVPAVFPKSSFPKLLSLKGDEGAGKWLNEERDRIRVIPSPVSLKDIDTPEDYQALLKKK